MCKEVLACALCVLQFVASSQKLHFNQLPDGFLSNEGS